MDSSHMEGDLFLAPPPPNVEAIDLGAPLDLCVKRRDRSPEEDVELPTPPKLVRNSAPPSLRPHHQQISKASLEALGVGTTAFEIHQEQIRQLQMISGLFGRALVDSSIPTLPPMPQLKQREQSAVGLTALSETSSLGGFSEDEEAGSSHSQGRKSQDSHSDHEADDASNRGTPNTEELLRKPLLLGFRRETLIKSISKLGVRGEVTYYGPCGKRLKSYPDINRYLQRKGFAAHLARENFTFNNKFNIGDFFEGGYPKDGGCRLSEGEVNQRIDNLRGDSASRKRAAMDRAFQKEREREREKERQKQRELEKEKKKEEQRLEKERRLKALEEEKKRKQAEAESRRQAEILAKVQERELRRQQQALMREQEMAKRREMIAMLETEKERRRQHLGLIQALVLYQKSRDQVREVVPPPEQKAAVEDLELPADPKSRALSLPRLGELRVPASAYANLLLVDEFLTTFQKCIGYKGTIPSRAELEKALVNEGFEDELCSLVGQLLAICIVDPGLQNSRDASTVTGQHLRDITINRFTLTEALRLYFLALDKDGAIYQWVCEKPFLALNPTQKSEILAFLCNELLSNRSVIRHIDNCTEHLSILGRDRGIVEGELNKLRAVQRVRARRAEEREAANKEEKAATESGDAPATAAPPPVVDSPLPCAEEQNSAMSDDQLDGKVAKMEQTQCELSKKILETAAAIRSTMLGQDRYRRRFWILAQNGGIYVESLESAEQDGLGDFDADMLSATDGTEQEINDESGPASDMEEDDDGSQESEKPVDAKSEQTDQNTDATKTEDEAPDHDKENEVKPDLVNEMPEIKTEPKTEPADKSAEEKIETPLVNGEAVAPKDESDDSKKMEIKEDSKSKPEQPEAENGAAPSQEAPKAVPAAAATSADPAAQMHAVLRSMGIQDEMAQLLLANPFFTSMLATTMLMQGGGNIANMATILGQLHQLATLQKGPSAGGSAGALASNGVTNATNSVLPNAPPSLNPVAALAASTAAAAASTASGAGVAPVNSASADPANATGVTGTGVAADANSAPAPSPQNPTSSAVSSATATPSTVTAGGAPGAASASNAPSAAAPAVAPAEGAQAQTASSDVSSQPPVNAEQALKNIAQKKVEQEQANTGNHRRWFNILPREGCDGTGVVEEPMEEDRDDDEEDESMDESTEEKRLQTIPQVLRKGWWKITKRSELDDLYKVLNPDGYREKYLSESLSKVLMYNPDEVPFGLKGDPNDALSGLDLPAPSPDYEDQWNPKAALKVEIELLNELNSLQERVLQASMQVRGVRNDDDDTTVPQSADDPAWMASTAFLLHEKYVRAKEEKLSGRQKVKRQRNNKKKSRAERRRLAALAKLQEKQRNEEEEEEEEKEEDEESDEDLKPPTPPPGVKNPIEIAKERLLNLESAIERRYLRPPLGRGQVPIPHGPTTASSTRGGFNHREEKKDEEDNISRELRRWRDGVAKCTGAAQIHLCLMQLESCIAWEKSIMKANCQFCGSGENEESLLLCDACDKGYHTYCFKPEMVVPQGDWFCFECINSVNLNKVCVICGKPGNTKMAQCDVCPKLFHPACVNLAKVPPRKWTCVACTVPSAEIPEAETPAPSKKRSSSSRNRSATKEKKSKSTSDTTPANVATATTNGQEKEEKDADPKDIKDHKDAKDTKDSKESKEKEKEKEKDKDKDKDVADGAPKEKRARKGRASAASLKKQQQASERVLGECKLLLDELCDHDAAWPFLYPVNPKECPTYRKIIKRPMDLQTIRNKIESGVYNICEDFADDARLMFSNCETFNEPNSPVGKAGRRLRLFFEKRYTEILDSS